MRHDVIIQVEWGILLNPSSGIELMIARDENLPFCRRRLCSWLKLTTDNSWTRGGVTPRWAKYTTGSPLRHRAVGYVCSKKKRKWFYMVLFALFFARFLHIPCTKVLTFGPRMLDRLKRVVIVRLAVRCAPLSPLRILTVCILECRGGIKKYHRIGLII